MYHLHRRLTSVRTQPHTYVRMEVCPTGAHSGLPGLMLAPRSLWSLCGVGGGASPRPWEEWPLQSSQELGRMAGSPGQP